MQSVEDPHQERERVIPMMILARRRRSMQPKRQYPLTTEVPRHVSNVERLAILPIDAPEIREIKTTTIVEGRITMLIDTPTLVINLSSSRPRKRRKCFQKSEDGYDPDLDGYYIEDSFPRYRSHD
jgi:hypothetical protein